MTRVTIHGWLPNGVAIDITEDDMPYGDALALANDWLTQGLLTAPPAFDPSEKELITTVMRREKSDGTPIIDFYPEWGAGTAEPYGTYKFVHKYMNNDGDVDQFLNASGFNSLNDIPLYDGQAPLKRNIGKPHPKETRVPTPFMVLRKQGKEKIDSEGKPYNPWELAGYEVAPQHARQNASESRQDSPNSSAVPPPAQNGWWTQDSAAIVKFLAAAQKSFSLSHGQVIEALKYFSVDPLENVEHFTGTKEEAWAACIAFVCKYDPAAVASFPGIAVGMRDLTIEMIELHEVPF